MATVKQFEDLHVWQEARNLVRSYQITKDTQFRRDFSLRDQITRASTSTMSYRSPLYVALDQNYLDRTTFNGLHASTLSLSRAWPNLSITWKAFPVIRDGLRITSHSKPT